ncbi:Cation Diffusion Facilitator (CDF) Family [Phytophthora palmivora]|uniref:Cation Diffusion Facilitator (CDF) Family n=1 Tax=Phytophthora palmivora TaxID=4796 RepID=A0A2P4Y9J1_9STRA|nr:Cation Diffusion Facilitator (CDF) Family [Phytophthora palmivora]
MSTDTDTKATHSSPRSFDQPSPCKHQPSDATLIDPSRRIPLTNSAKNAQRKLLWACLCSVLFMAAEVVGGYLAGSLAIMADAAHLLTDVTAFCISLFAIWMSTRPPTNRLSFGFHRTEVVGAVTSVLVIWVLTGVLVYAAVNRFIECFEPNPAEHVDGKLMFIVACIGLLVNVVLMQILGHATVTVMEVQKMVALRLTVNHGHTHDDHVFGGDLEIGHNDETAKLKVKEELENLNIRSAYMHALADFIQSIGVCIAGALIWLKPEWQIADPIATFIFSVLVLFTTVGIVRDSIHILMEGTPNGIDAVEIEEGLRACSSVVGVHDLHI